MSSSVASPENDTVIGPMFSATSAAPGGEPGGTTVISPPAPGRAYTEKSAGTGSATSSPQRMVLDRASQRSFASAAGGEDAFAALATQAPSVFVWDVGAWGRAGSGCGAGSISGGGGGRPGSGGGIGKHPSSSPPTKPILAPP